MRCPGTLQKNVYVPGLSFTVSVFVPPLNVGVAPMVGPLVPCWIVRLCASGEALVNAIVTVPAFAVSDAFVNFSAPLGSAACVSELLGAPLGALALVAADDVVELAGALEVALDDCVLLVLLLLDPPHAARPSARAAVVTRSAGSLCTSGSPLGSWMATRSCGAIADTLTRKSVTHSRDGI